MTFLASIFTPFTGLTSLLVRPAALFAVLFFCAVPLFGQTTYTWIGANNASWATSTNWSPTRTTPATNDILQFNDGTTKNVTGVPTQTIGRLLVTNNTSITLQNTALLPRTLTVGDGTGDDIVIALGSSLTIGGANALTVTLNTNATADVSGTLRVNSGHGYNTNGTSVVTTVTGTIVNAGTVTSTTASKLLFNSGSTYQHNRNGGTIPTATWNANSTCEVILASSAPTGTGQTFGHFIWAPTNQGTNNVNLAAGFSCSGNMTVSATATTGALRFNNSTGSRTITISGNYVHTSGNVTVTNSSGATTVNVGGNFDLSGGLLVLKNASGTTALNITGNFSQAGGTFDQRASITTGTGTVTVSTNFSVSGGTYDLSGVGAVGMLNVAGNFSITGSGTITETSTGSGSIVFNGSGTQIYTSGGTVSNTVNFTVNNGSYLQMADGTTVVSGGGSFTLSSGATLGVTSSAGITTSGASGNIQVSGTRTYSTGAHYIYNGTAAQATGNGLTQNIPANLTINNSAGVTLTASTNLTGDLMISSGTFDLGANTANRSSSGGTLTLGAGTTLKIGGTGSLPSNYATHSISSSSTVEYYGGNQTVAVLNSAQNYGNLLISGTGTKTLAGTVGIAGNLTVSSSTFDLGTFTANRTAAGGTLTVGAGASLRIGGTNSYPTNYTTNTLNIASTVEYYGSTQTISFTPTYGNLSLSGSGPKTTPTGTTTTAVAGNFTLASGITYQRASGATSTLTLNGTTNLNDGTLGSLANPFNTVNVGDAGGDNLTNNGTMVVATTLAGSGSLTQGTNAALYIGGTFTTTTVTLTANPNLVEYNGTGAQTIRATNYNNLTLSNAGTKTAAGNLTVSGNFNNSVTTSMVTFTLGISGTRTNTGTVQFAGETNGIVFSDGTVEYNGTSVQAPAGQTVALGTYANLLFTNNATKRILGGTVRTQSNLTIGSVSPLSVESTGTLQVDADLDIQGSVTNAGTISIGN